MRRSFVIILFCILLWGLPIVVVGDHNPENPADPYTYQKVVVSASPTSCYTSGTGNYLSGTQIMISTSSNNINYVFSHWTKDGERITEPSSFYYTVEDKKTVFVANYTYSPNDPSDPSAYNLYRLHLTTNKPTACSFNLTSGTKVEAETYITVSANVNSNYEFEGWYENGTRISSSSSFSYLMPENTVTLQANLRYNPANPDDPTSSTEDVANSKLGDVNGDKDVDVMDAIALIGAYLNGTASSISKSVGDVNKDDDVDVMDAIEIISIYLNGN